MMKVKLFIILSAVALFGAGCISFGGGGGGGADGGIFKSADRGENWQQKSAIPTAGGVKSFVGVDIAALAIDPQDHQAIYAGATDVGLFYSYDSGESWMRSKDIVQGFVAAIAVDPRNTCTVYLATGHRILKTTDCSRTYKEIYREPSAQTFLTALTINPFNSQLLYAGTVNGTLIKSRDGGATWALERTLSRHKVIDIIVDPRNSATRYIALQGGGLWKTINDGATLEDISEPLKEFKNARDARRLVADKATADELLLASRHSILRSHNGGASWETLPILSPENVEILALAVNPQNSSEIYYGTATTFYRSADGGQNWSTKKLPSSRAASVIMVDSEAPETVYLGLRKIEK